jgi:hypothetical protein
VSLKTRCITRNNFEQVLLPSSTLSTPSAHYLRLQLHDDPTDPAKPLLSHSEGVLVVTLDGPSSSPSASPLPLLFNFGGIRTLKIVKEHSFMCEFWDDRSSEEAMKVLDGREAGGARFRCTFKDGMAVSPLRPCLVIREGC